MEAAPPGLDPQAIGEALVNEAGVVEVHDLHVWEVTTGMPALSAHMIVRQDVEHSTLQVEHEAEDDLLQIDHE